MLRFEWINLGSSVSIALLLSACGGGGGGDTPQQPQQPQQPTTFTVGGTVAGLSGSVVLRLNGGNDLTVNASGTFTFAAQLANGTSYTVTIAGQPNTQVCGPGVTNGTGAINGANVTNVAIACASYSVGGNVTGLTGAGLELQVNGANDLTVAASSPASVSFTFPASVSLGGILYTVRIKTQPAGQTCTILDSTGVVTASAPNITSVSVACIANVTDPLSGTYRVTAVDGEPIDARAFLTFYPDGTYIFGIHGDQPTDECGATRGNGVQYGVYRWNQASHAFALVTHAIDTVVDCGFDEGTAGVLVVNADGTLSVQGDEEDDSLVLLAPIPSVAGTLIGSWGDNQAFGVYSDDARIFNVNTRRVVQNAASSAGIEDGCYALSGSTASGTFTLDFSGSCAVGAGLTAIDTTGSTGLSAFGSNAVNFTVTSDSLQYTVPGIGLTAPASLMRITTITPPPSTFSVSGTITGLTGTGLGLRLNGEIGPTFNATPAAGAGAFAFTAALLSGDTYRVSIVGEPASPTQFCFFTGGAVAGGAVGTITTSDVTNVAINCLNSAAYTASGAVSGLTAAGLSLRMSYFNILTGASGLADLSLAASGNFAFPAGTIPANNFFAVGIQTQPAGQTCMVTRTKAFSLAADITNLGVVCVNNTTDPLRGTYSFLDEHGRGYVNFNADGSFTTALIHSRPPADPDPSYGVACNTAADTRNGNGVEYGVFTWNQSTGAFALPAPPVVDTNGDCGLASSDFPESFGGFISRVGQTIVLRESAGGPVLVTASAVESNPGSLVGAFIPEANNGLLMVFHADGTFVSAETQLNGLFPLGYGQERGCYSVSGSSVILTIDASCRPDGFDAYDLNGNGGSFINGITTTAPLPFTLPDANTLTLFGGTVFKRTQPN